MGKFIGYYVWRILLLLLYTAVGLFLFFLELLWNHGLFSGGVELVPVFVEWFIFIGWIISGIIGSYFICHKKLRRTFIVIGLAAAIIGCCVGTPYFFNNVIPNVKMTSNVNQLRKNAEAEFDTDINSGRYHTFFFDEDNIVLSQWVRYSKGSPKYYDSIYTYYGEKTNITYSELPRPQMMKKLEYEKVKMYCFSGDDYFAGKGLDYPGTEAVYVEYNGQMYCFNKDIGHFFYWDGPFEDEWYRNSANYENLNKINEFREISDFEFKVLLIDETQYQNFLFDINDENLCRYAYGQDNTLIDNVTMYTMADVTDKETISSDLSIAYFENGALYYYSAWSSYDKFKFLKYNDKLYTINIKH